MFKSFRTHLPSHVVDCHGVTHVVPAYTPDSVWRVQSDALRLALRNDFAHLMLLTDSADTRRAQVSGFDGIAIYDNMVDPSHWVEHAAACTRRGFLFSFNTNPGYDEIPRREVEPDSCYAPRPFVPGPRLDWSDPADRRRARQVGEGRILESLRTTLELQTDRCFTNSQKGFLLVYINSFNEWHQFEPMKDWTALRLPSGRSRTTTPLRAATGCAT